MSVRNLIIPSDGGGGGGEGSVNFSAGTTSNNLSNLVFSNSNGVTFGLDGSTITASVPAVGGAQTGISGVIVSNATYTSGSVSFSNQNNITIGSSVNGATQFIRLSVGNYITTGMLSNAATISNVNLSAGTTSQNLSAMVFSNSNGVSFGLNGSTVTGTVATNYQSQGAYITTAMQSNAATISNINVSAGTTSNNLSAVTFSNVNGVSFGLNGSVVTASVAAAGGAQTGISGLIVSDATYTSGTVSLSAQNNITIGSSTNGATQFIRLSVGNYITTGMLSNAATISNVNVSAGTTSNNLSAMVFSNSNGLSFGLNGSTVTASYTVPTQSAETVGLYASSNTYLTSSGTQDIRSLSFRGDKSITIGYSAGELLFSVGAYLTTAMLSNAATISNVNLSAGTTSQNLSAMVFSNSNGVSFGLNGSTVTASVAAAGGAQTGISGIIASDATYTSGTVSFSNQNGVTIGSSTNGATQYILLSVATNYQSQGAYLTTADLSQNSSQYIQHWNLTGNKAGTTSSSQGVDLWLAGGNGITLSGSSNTISFSVATNYQSQAAYLTTADLSQNSSQYIRNWKLTGNTSGTTSSAQGTDFWLAGGNGVTISGSSNSLSFSVATNYQAPGAYLTTADLSQNSSLYAGVNGAITGGSITVNTSGVSVAYSVIKGFGASNVGNTAGNTGMVTGVNWVLAGSTNITVSQSTAAGGPNTLWLSAPNAGGGGGIVLAGSNTTYTSGTVTISGVGGGVTVNSNTGQRIDISVGAYITTGALSTNNVYASGTTFGTSSGTYDARSLSIAGSGGVGVAASDSGWVISGPVVSVLTGVSPVSISSAGSTVSVLLNQVSQWDPFCPFGNMVTNSTLGNSSLFFQPFDLPYPLSASRINFFLSIGTSLSASLSSGSGSFGIGYGLYTRGTGASTERLSQLTSYSAVIVSYTASSNTVFGATHYIGLSNATSHSTSHIALTNANATTYAANSLAGFRVVALPLGLSLTPGRYWLGFSQQSTTNAPLSIYDIGASYMQQTMSPVLAFRPFGTSGAASNASVYDAFGGVGTYSAQSGAWPASIGLSNSDIRGGPTVTLPYFNISGIGTATNLL